MAEGVILKSQSFEAEGEETRVMNLENTLTGAGYKPVKEPPPEEEESKQLTMEQRLEKNMKSYTALVKEAKEKYDDWEDAVGQEIFVGQGVQLALLEQPNGADVAYYLGKHPAFAKKLGEMSKTPGREISAIREVEAISRRLAASMPRREAPPPRGFKPAPDSTFAEVAALPNFPGKARALKRALARR